MAQQSAFATGVLPDIYATAIVTTLKPNSFHCHDGVAADLKGRLLYVDLALPY